ncbi:site-specific DNA-methyltransferase [Anaerobaca lacustris]|uniref:site-specific DNA-methyltransferase (adenine-specific) n=1 Tax=Anaerobaca lacustris TaxID=3044600 RepID=A0AAW6U0M2_9BACT|nr:site-specific DNA-methyltransferase [Sedimentisphaerales bacterium M17dextr]
MAKSNTRLELTWIGKENRPKLEPRVLIEDAGKSYHAARRVSENDFFDNRLIFGDNLLALRALEQEFTGRIKCIYIDPPYNTGSAFTHYHDGIEHSLWLSLMRDRLEILRRLLAENGSIWISIDDNEMPYLRILLDEVFGRANFIAQCIWEKVYSPKSSAKFLSENHDYVVCYARDVSSWKRNLLPRTEKQDRAYKNPDNDPRGPWKPSDLSARNYYSVGRYPIKCPSGRVITGPPQGMYWRVAKERLEEMDREGRIWWGKDGNNVPAIKRFLSEVIDGIVPETIWTYDEVGHNQAAKQHLKKLLPDVEELFVTPKPEGLIERILTIASNLGDWVLDSFAGTGTTGTTAQKMGRRWIMVELGDHCHTHIIPRMKKVIDGEDQGGISKAVDWKGGGGFRYYRLGPSLIVEDEWGNPVINPEFNAAMLAEAMCKLEGFTFDPNPDVYWQQGRSSETDFIYVTTQFMSKDMLAKLSDEVGPNRSLLICCSAFRCDVSQFENLTVKKIPKAVLKKCEWGHDDYSLEIENLPDAPPEVVEQHEAQRAGDGKPVRRFGKGKEAGPTLFDMAQDDSKGGEK